MISMSFNRHRNPGRRHLATGVSVLVLATLLVAAPPTIRWPESMPMVDWRAHASGGEGGDGGGGGSDGGGSDSSGSGSSGGDDSSGSGSGGSDDSSGSDGSGDDSGEGGDDNSGEGGDDNSGEGGDDSAARGSESDRRAIAGELVVVDEPAGFGEQVAAFGYSVIDRRSLASLDIVVTRLRLPRGVSIDEATQLLQRSFPDVQIVENSIYAPSGQITIPAPDYARLMLGWNSFALTCAEGFRIGLVDTRVDASAPALTGRTIETRLFLPADVPEAPPLHGTAVAEILAGETAEIPSLVPGPVLLNAAIFEQLDDGSSGATAVAFAEALDWLASEGVPLVNVSLAGNRNPLITLAIDRASARGMLLVAAVGNAGPAAGISWPAAHPDVIAVTAIGPDAAIYEFAGRGPEVDFAAPGIGIWSPGTDGVGRFDSGTSFAAPFVTAAAAAWIAAGHDPNADRLRTDLAKRAGDLGAPGRDPEFGIGLINLADACREEPTQ
jgi:hypothetical protein